MSICGDLRDEGAIAKNVVECPITSSQQLVQHNALHSVANPNKFAI